MTDWQIEGEWFKNCNCENCNCDPGCPCDFDQRPTRGSEGIVAMPMSVGWMTAVAVLIFAEKVLPRGDRLPSVLAVALVAGGIWVAVAPASVPGLR